MTHTYVLEFSRYRETNSEIRRFNYSFDFVLNLNFQMETNCIWLNNF